MGITLLGLKACDTCRGAQKLLTAAGHSVTLRDVRAEPLGADEIADLLAEFGAALINRRSTTWRGLDEQTRAYPPQTLLAAHPALMKRPVVVSDRRRFLGWTPEAKAALI